jgi:two-component system sensor histidine kinase HydH
MDKSRFKGRYFPVIAIVASVFILSSILIISAYKNYYRERELLERLLLSEGLALIRSFEAGTRTGMMSMRWERDDIQALVEETARQPDIAYIAIVDKNGQIMAHSNPNMLNTHLKNSPDLLATVRKEGVVTNFLEFSGKEKIFEIAKSFNPINKMSRWKRDMWQMMERRWNWWCNPPQRGIKAGKIPDPIIILGLRTGDLEAAQAEDIRRSIFLTSILFLIGSVSFYIVSLIQRNYTISKSLANVESYNRNVVESMTNGLVTVDRDGKISSINQVAGRIFGFQENEVIGEPYYRIFSPDRCDLTETISGGKNIINQKVNCQRKTGESIPLKINASQLVDEEGEVLGAVILLEDLRQIKELEDRLQRSERLASLGRLAAGIAHEIRNPLSSIKGFAQYFRNKYHSQPEDKEGATIMIGEVDRLNRVIGDLLNFAHPQEPRKEMVSISDIIDHSLKLVENDAQQKGIAIIKEPEDELPLILADRDQLTQAFLNIFLNSLTAMEEGGELRISTSILPNSTGIEVNISDTGCGIPPDDLPRIFDPFFSSRKTGTGLGLAIVHNIIEKHGGEIEVESQVGRGTTFKIKLFNE